MITRRHVIASTLAAPAILRFDPAQAARTRRKLLERAAGEDLKLIPGHLRAQTMRIVEANGKFLPVVEG